jgi:hypothetical protein
MKKLTLHLTVLTLSTTACQVVSYTGPHGEHFSGSSFASKTSIQSLSVEITTTAIDRVDLRG